MPSSFHFHFLLVFPILTLISGLPFPSSLIQTTCNATTHYNLCISSLKSDPNVLRASDVKTLSAISIGIALASSIGSGDYVAGLARNETAEGAVAAALGGCAKRYGNARESLEWAREAVGEDEYDYAAVHVGAAKGYPSMCYGLFRRGNLRLSYPAELGRRAGELEGLCGLALDLVYLLG